MNKKDLPSHYSSFSIHHSKWGFTLIELMIVMTIIAILTGLSVVGFQGTRKSARDGRRKADLEQIRSALEVYRNDCRQYPETDAVDSGAALAGTQTTGTACLTTDIYMQTVPSDPDTSYSYTYSKVSTNQYTLCAYLETLGAGATAGSGCGNCGATCNYKVTNP